MIPSMAVDRGSGEREMSWSNVGVPSTTSKQTGNVAAVSDVMIANESFKKSTLTIYMRRESSFENSCGHDHVYLHSLSMIVIFETDGSTTVLDIGSGRNISKVKSSSCSNTKSSIMPMSMHTFLFTELKAGNRANVVAGTVKSSPVWVTMDHLIEFNIIKNIIEVSYQVYY